MSPVTTSLVVVMVSTFCAIAVDSQLPKFGLPKLNVPKLRMPEITRVRAEELYDCPDEGDLAVSFKNIVLSYVGPGKVRVNGVLEIKETIEKPIMMETQMYKCVSKSEPDTCEFYHTFRPPEVCALLGVSKRFYNAFKDATDLPKKCPFPKGTYNVSDAVVDMSDMNSLPLFESYWKFQNRGYHDNKQFMCVICEFSVNPAYRGRH